MTVTEKMTASKKAVDAYCKMAPAFGTPVILYTQDSPGSGGGIAILQSARRHFVRC